MVVIARLTDAAARDRLSNDDAAAMGLAAPLLSPVWTQAAPGAFDPGALSVANTDLLAPFLGILEIVDTPRDVFELDGSPVAGQIGRYRMHPQAAARLETLARNRYAGAGMPLHHPVATQVVMRAAIAEPQAPQWYEPGDSFTSLSPNTLTGTITFHDSRGLIVCPAATAALYADILTAFPLLETVSPDCPVATPTVNSPGGLAAYRDLAGSGTVVHVIDPHGNLFVPALPDRTLTRRSGTTVTEILGTNGLIDLPPGDSFAASDADDAAEAALSDDTAHDFDTGARLRWGWSNGGRLSRDPLPAPALADGTLDRQFLRLTVVDLDWHLLGNRTTSIHQGIPPDDGLIPEAYLPKVRPEVPIGYLSDGMATLAAAGQALSTLVADTGDGSILVAVSPVLQPGLITPPAGDATGRWPAFPAAVGTPVPGLVGAPAAGIAASFVAGGTDVVVTLAADAVAAEAHVRIYPRQFVEIESIGAEPSFLRGDGGAGIASAGQPLPIFLSDPLALGGAPAPSPAVLTMDIVVTPRLGTRRLFANVVVTVTGTGAVAPPDPFTGPANIVDLVDDFVGAIAPSPLFGLPNLSPPPPAQPGNFLDLVRQHLSESTPRQGPRLPTQARFETMIATCVAAGNAFDWDATVSGARWAGESRSVLHGDGNPGNPAGPDVHAPGVRVRGDLGLDVARQAMRRAQPMLPLPGSPPMLGWIAMQGGANFNRPAALPPGAATSPDLAAGALLKTVAAFCETPELGPTTFPLTDQPVVAQQQYDALLQAIANAFGLAQPPDIDFEFGNEDRLGSEIVKEIYTARHGARDALWALRRAFGQARELVYIEGPQFARTARPEDAPGAPAAHMIDLVEVLAQRMAVMPSLRVVVCLSRAGDFAPDFGGWVRQSIEARNEAVQMLRDADAERVAVFHPRGFPGRPAHLRSTCVVVDDCWAMVGTSHLRRRGMTFDGAADIVSIPYDMTGARAANLAGFRRDIMARKLGLEPTRAADRRSAEWARLWEMDAAFTTIRDLLDQGGAGRLTPLWEGPQDAAVLPATPDMADPDGSDGATLFSTLAGLFAESGSG